MFVQKEGMFKMLVEDAVVVVPVASDTTRTARTMMIETARRNPHASK